MMGVRQCEGKEGEGVCLGDSFFFLFSSGYEKETSSYIGKGIYRSMK